MNADQIRKAPLWRRWIFALKPAAWPKMAAPALLGAGLAAAPGASSTATATATGAFAALLWTVAMTVMIVTLNDWADEPVDRLRRALLGARCGPRTLVDGILPSRALLAAGVVAALTVVGVGLLVMLASGRKEPAVLSLASVACFAAYSLPPVRLNSRGGGELLEAFGVGVLLPLAIASLLGPLPTHPGINVLLGGAFALALVSALLSGLSDEVSDRQGGKVTAVTRLGAATALRLAAMAFAMVPVTLVVAAAMGWVRWVVALAALVPMGWLKGLPVREAGVSMNLEAQGFLKRRVHRVIAALLLLFAVVAATLPRLVDAAEAPGAAGRLS